MNNLIPAMYTYTLVTATGASDYFCNTPQYENPCTQTITYTESTPISCIFSDLTFKLDANTNIYLLKKLEIVYSQNGDIYIPSWGIICNIDNIDKEIPRKFLELLSKSKSQILNDEEKQLWLNIVNDIDFKRFSADTSPLRYMCGVVESNKHKTIVKWDSGEKETLVGTAKESLALLKKGDRFSCWGKIGYDNQTTHIERLQLVYHEVTQEDIDSLFSK